jgi:selenide,water dikinase
MGPADLQAMIAPLTRTVARGDKIRVGLETGDDAGVYDEDGLSLVATADFITPVCDDPQRFGRVAAANSLSDVYAMGGRPLFALNLCCFPGVGVPDSVFAAILEGAATALQEASAALLGGHTVRDAELKFGLAVVGRADPEHLLTNAGARAGDRLLLTKPLGTGVLINAFRKEKIDAAALEPALVEMERLNAVASSLALKHGTRAATDITGFGLSGHLLGMLHASGVGARISFPDLPVYEGFFDMARQGVTTGCTGALRTQAEPILKDRVGLDDVQRELLHDPQTSGGLLLSVDRRQADALLDDLCQAGHRAAAIGEVLEGPPQLQVVEQVEP